MTLIRKPLARRAIAFPIRPNPTIPRVFPHTSVPTSWSKSQPFQLPDRASTSPSSSRRPTAISSVQAKSAVVSSSTPGVFVATTPRFVHAATSILSKPTATFAVIFNFGAACSNSSFTFSVSKQISASLSFRRRSTSSRGGRSGFSQYSASQFSSRILLAGSNNRCVARTFGFTIYPQPVTRGLHTNTLAYPACNFTLRGCRESHYSARCVFFEAARKIPVFKEAEPRPPDRCFVIKEAVASAAHRECSLEHPVKRRTLWILAFFAISSNFSAL